MSDEKSGIGIQDPVVRQTVLEATSDLKPGKTLLLGSLDIPGTSRHQESKPPPNGLSRDGRRRTARFRPEAEEMAAGPRTHGLTARQSLNRLEYPRA